MYWTRRRDALRDGRLPDAEMPKGNEYVEDSGEPLNAGGTRTVVGATAWFPVHAEGSLDYRFIDEVGQTSSSRRPATTRAAHQRAVRRAGTPPWLRRAPRPPMCEWDTQSVGRNT